jgi:hypothetical protein
MSKRSERLKKQFEKDAKISKAFEKQIKKDSKTIRKIEKQSKSKILKNKYNDVILSTRTDKFVDTKRISISKKGKMLSIDNVRKLNESIDKKLKNNGKGAYSYSVIAYGASGAFTLKTFQGNFSIDSHEEYLQGNMKFDNLDFYDEFFKIDVIVTQHNENFIKFFDED